MSLKILSRLHIKPVPTILHKEEIWPHQNLMRFQSMEALQRVVDLEVKANKGLYLFFKLEVGHTHVIYMDETPVGSRLDHGEGKRGLTWPRDANCRHLTFKEAEDCLRRIGLYFEDLAVLRAAGLKMKVK
jgi:hypothetical protein